MLYAAYGMNTNFDQMAKRCPAATHVGTATLDGWRMDFTGVADIRQRLRERMQVALWNITHDCERALDRLEGYPNLYVKQFVRVRLDGSDHAAMIYLMRDRLKRLAPPSDRYFNMLFDGYQANGINMRQLLDAEERAAIEAGAYTAGGFVDPWAHYSEA